MPMPVIPDVDLLPANPPNTNDPLNFDPRADAFVAALVLMVVQLNAFIEAIGLAGAFIEQRAEDTNTYATQADGRATAATLALAGALSARDACLAYAQAMGGAAGIPDPIAFGVFAADGDSAVAFRDLATLPAMLAKANRDGAVVTRMSTNRQVHTPAAGATLALDVAAAGEHVITAVGTLTLSFANVPPGNVSFVLTLDCTNFGNKLINWPPGTIFIKADGSFATSVGNAGVTWQATGTDFVIAWFKNGVPYCKVVR